MNTRMKTEPEILLALDPGTREMGVVVLENEELVDYRVKTFRNGRNVKDLLEQAHRIMTRLLEEFDPDGVVIEKPFFAKTRRSALLVFLVQELRSRVRRGKIDLFEYGPRRVREILLGNPKGTKRDIARHVADRFPELRQHLHTNAHWKEKYWSHVFDAVGLALAHRQAVGREQSPRR
ncbi:MAG: crossover junction endodeoxyribonuclease RuvC [Candidatus Eisenbacteria bacterium]